MSQQEFDTLKEELARSRQETAAVIREVDSWQNSTLLILKQYLIENPGKLKLKMESFTRTHITPTSKLLYQFSTHRCGTVRLHNRH